MITITIIPDKVPLGGGPVDLCVTLTTVFIEILFAHIGKYNVYLFAKIQYIIFKQKINLLLLLIFHIFAVSGGGGGMLKKAGLPEQHPVQARDPWSRPPSQ